MSEQTKIEWADSTVNFWSGCTKVSAGCAHCYAETLSNRFPSFGRWGAGQPRKHHPSAIVTLEKLNRRSLKENRRRRVFINSMADWLDPEVPTDWLAELLRAIRACPALDFILCTKRPEQFHPRMEAVWARRDFNDPAKGVALAWSNNAQAGTNDDGTPMFLPPSNVVVLASVENQEMADERIPALLEIPAPVHGLSCEPLLGPLDISQWLVSDYDRAAVNHQLIEPLDGFKHKKLRWIILGGESGQDARPCNVSWIHEILWNSDACPMFVKQLGSNPVVNTSADFESIATKPLKLKHSKGGEPSEWPTMNDWPHSLNIRKFYHDSNLQ